MKVFFYIIGTAFFAFFMSSLAGKAQTPPLAPTFLNTSVADYNKVNLTWVDESSDETEFRIERSPAYSGLWSEIKVSASGSFSFSDSNRPAGSYDYRVRACNSFGCSGYSNTSTVTLIADTIIPTTPGNFSIAKASSATSADLSWTASSDNTSVSSYYIYRSPGTPSNFSFIASVSSSILKYTDKSLSPVSHYFFQVRAVDPAGNLSAPSATASIITLSLNSAGNYIRLVSPNGGECFNIPGNLPIVWTGVGVNQVAAYYNSRGSANSRIFSGNSTQFNWYMTASVSANPKATVWVVAVDGNGVEGIADTNDNPFILSYDCKNEKNITSSTPNVPSFFTAALVNEKRDIKLNWQDNSTNETEFRIYRRSLPDGKWAQIGNVGPNITSFIDSVVPPGDYEYDANACSGSICSTYSNQFKITAHPTLPETDPRRIYAASELKIGDLVSASETSDPDIYIINEYGYKRLFLNPVIFGFYGHLGGFEKVKKITAPTRNTYQTSGLFRNCETGDPKIYGVEITGEDTAALHWVNTTGEKAIADDSNFFKKVFCINNNEFNWYQKGSDYYSVKEIPLYNR